MAAVVLDSLKCPICHDFADTAVETKCCKHIYCQHCIQTYKDKKCPHCHKKDTKYEISVAIRRIIANIPTECPFQCGMTPNRGNMEQHKGACQKRPICPLTKCKVQGNEEQIAKHIHDEHVDIMMASVRVAMKLEAAFDLPITNLEPKLRTICYVNSSEPVKCKNSMGRLAKMGPNGKFYCGSESSVFRLTNHGRTRVNMKDKCGPSRGLNCDSCMRLDVQVRNLPLGCLVNSEARITRAKPCHHPLSESGPCFERKVRPLMCHLDDCGTHTDFHCDTSGCTYDAMCDHCLVIACIVRCEEEAIASENEDDDENMKYAWTINYKFCRWSDELKV